MPGAKYGTALKKSKQGQSITEGIMYFMMMALLISVFILIFEIVIPGREFVIPGVGTYFISYDFYRVNSFYFNTFASMLGLGISFLLIRIHKRSVEKRILKFAKGMN